MGYSYIGPNSFYRLTVREIRRLQRGYAKLNNVENKGPRESDYKKLAAFKKKRGLR